MAKKELLTIRCPEDLIKKIESQMRMTGLDKTSVVIEMLRQSFPVTLFEDLNKLPEVPAIYFVFASNRLLYIGRANNLRKKWDKHHRLEQFSLMRDVKIAWFKYEPNINLLIEASLIELLDAPNCSEELLEEFPGVINIVDRQLLEAVRERCEQEKISQTEFMVKAIKTALAMKVHEEAFSSDVLNQKIDERIAPLKKELETLKEKLKSLSDNPSMKKAEPQKA
ncbi:MAG: GIY-YIG nuclease family protein [Prochloraceae cyanobacterium]|nr:GIY-YIG nuclease family protein [Prochloraceae cyanobacterium]